MRELPCVYWPPSGMSSSNLCCISQSSRLRQEDLATRHHVKSHTRSRSGVNAGYLQSLSGFLGMLAGNEKRISVKLVPQECDHAHSIRVGWLWMRRDGVWISLVDAFEIKCKYF